MTTPQIAPLTGYRADIQVLRGLAVLLVVMYHADLVFDGGYIGVDVFFVLSGFVIGRLILHELVTTDRLSFRDFYARRFRRILPALAVMLVVVVLMSPLLAPLAAGGKTNATAAASALFSANFYLFAQDVGGYFATASTLNPLLHTWSLAVEEQFYLVIPAMLFATWRVTARRTRIDPITTARILVAGITLVSLLICIALSLQPSLLANRGLQFAYYMPFTRAWEFCIGIGLVLLPARWAASRPTSRVLFGLLGYGGIAAAAAMFSDATIFPGYMAILPVAATAFAIHAAAPVPRLARPMVILGDLSYGWYLWHWPFIVFAAAFWTGAGATPLVIAAVASLIPAVLSRQLLERRFIAHLPTTRPGRTTALLATSCITIPLVAIALSMPIAARTAEVAGVALVQDVIDANDDRRADPCGAGVPLGPDTPQECVLNPGGSPTIVLIGDSNAVQFFGAMRTVAEAVDARVELAGFRGCPLLGSIRIQDGWSSNCNRFRRDSLAELGAHPRDIVIVGFAPTTLLEVHGYRTASAGAENQLAADASEALETILAAGSRTILIKEVPKPGWLLQSWSPGNCSALAAIVDLDKCGFPSFDPRSTPDFDEARRVAASVVSTTGVEAWDLDDWVCPDYRCAQYIDGSAIFGDSGHAIPTGASRVTGRIIELLGAPEQPTS